MLIAVAALQIAVLLAVVALFLRKSAPAQSDPRLAQLPEQLSRLDGRAETLDSHVRSALDSMRHELATEAQATREANATASTALRTEITTSITSLGAALNIGLEGFRADTAISSGALRTEVEQKMHSISQGFSAFKEEINAKHSALKQSLSEGLVELMGSNNAHQEKLRDTVEERLTKLNTDNTAKLEEMRATVDEKLQATLNNRLTASFGQVATHLGEVQKGLGEMKELATGINDLNRVFSNVTRRGDVGEAILGDIIKQILAPVQFRERARVNPGTRQEVEYAVLLPSATGEALLPIDSKFPREDWKRLQTAMEAGVSDDIRDAGKKFEAAIRTQAKLISETYINEPITTPYAIMFLPTESLYAEIIRRDGLQHAIQRDFHITIAGPSTLSAILISFKMGFRLLNLQQKGNDVRKVLIQTRTEFSKFGKLLDSAEKQVGTVQNTMHDLGVRTRAINRALDDVGDSAASPEGVLSFDGVAPQIAAGGDEG